MALVYYLNHSYANIEHSAIFVDWLNRHQKNALMLSYAGQNRRTPAQLLPYDLSHVYRIERPAANSHTGVPAHYAENDEPQPQEVVALGLRITNCEPSSPSL